MDSEAAQSSQSLAHLVGILGPLAKGIICDEAEEPEKPAKVLRIALQRLWLSSSA